MSSTTTSGLGLQLVRNQVASKPDDELQGLVDGKHQLIPCSNCRAILMDVWITRPHETDTYKLRAKCPWCGDKSFIVNITGGFYQGGYGSQKDGDIEESVESTCVDSFELNDDGVYEFTVMKASKDAKPLYK